MNVKIVRRSKGMTFARAMCIRRGYFTKGTIDEYEKFLDEFSTCRVLTDDDVIRITTLCFLHSDLTFLMDESGESVHEVFKSMAFAILKDCTNEFVEDA